MVKAIGAFAGSVLAAMSCLFSPAAQAGSVDVSVIAGKCGVISICYFYSVINNLADDYRIVEFGASPGPFQFESPPGFSIVVGSNNWIDDDYNTAIAPGQSGVFGSLDHGFKPDLFVSWDAIAEGNPSKNEPDLQFGGTLATVPEPSTWVIMVLGFAGLGFVGWRQRGCGRLRSPGQVT